MNGDIVREEHRIDRWGSRVKMREDIECVGLAKSLGWTVDLKGDERFLDSEGFLTAYKEGQGVHVACGGNTYDFSKPGKTVWYAPKPVCGQSFVRAEQPGDWMCADVSEDGRSSGHRRYVSLKDALANE